MPTILSLSAIHQVESLEDSDPLVRISAIHHFGHRLRERPDDTIRVELRKLLEDSDSLVARYVAINLAGGGDEVALDWLVAQIVQARGADEELTACLRSCSKFPFAAVLAERVGLETIAQLTNPDDIRHWQDILRLTADEFLKRARSGASWRNRFLTYLTGIHRTPGAGLKSDRKNRVLQCGRLLSICNENRPGFVCWPENGVFLQYFSEAVLNSRELQRGREVLFVAQPREQSQSSEVICMYVLEDAPPWSDTEILQALTPERLRLAEMDSPLIPGLVTEIQGRATVLCLNGVVHTEQFLSTQARIGQLALLQENAENGQRRAHFVPALFPRDAIPRMILTQFAQKNGLTRARISRRGVGRDLSVLHVESFPRPVSLQVPSVHRVKSVFVRKCARCESKGVVECPNCQTKGEVVCGSETNEFTCQGCKGKGTRFNPKTQREMDCVHCLKTGKVAGCGGNKRVGCKTCDRKGKLSCPKCAGTGQFKPSCRCDTCQGTGKRKCPACEGSGEKVKGDCHRCRNSRGECGFCRATGIERSGNTCRVCDGNGRCPGCGGTGDYSVECWVCKGDGEVDCRRCGATGHLKAIPCNLCLGAAQRECFACSGRGSLRCLICWESGLLPCKRCRSTGRLRCFECASQGWKLAHRLECDFE